MTFSSTSEDESSSSRGESSSSDESTRQERVYQPRVNLARVRQIFRSHPQRQTRRACRNPDRVNLEEKKLKKTKKKMNTKHHASDVQQESRLRRHIHRVQVEERSKTEVINIGPYVQQLNSVADELLEHQKTKFVKTEASVERAMTSLRLAKKQEERALLIRVNHLKEQFAARLEILEQQFVQQVDQVREELHQDIAVEKIECGKAVKKIASALERSMKYHIQVQIQQNQEEAETSENDDRQYRHQPKSTSRPKSCSSLSPLTKNQKKLQRLEAKLAQYSPEALRRAERCVMKVKPKVHANAEMDRVQQSLHHSQYLDDNDANEPDLDDWTTDLKYNGIHTNIRGPVSPSGFEGRNFQTTFH